MDLQLNEKYFKTNFDIRLGARSDECTDEGELSGAIPQVWARELEREYTEALWWQQFMGKNLNDGVVQKDELITQDGNQIFINRIAQLTNAGDLGSTHLLEADEEKLSLTRATFTPVRIGNAVCWPYIMGKQVSFNLRAEIKSLLAQWYADKIDNLLMTAAVASGNVMWGGVATSRATVVATDTFGAHELKRMRILLMSRKAKPVRGAKFNYICLVHPFQEYDLLNDTDWVAASRYDQSKQIFQGYMGTYMGIDVLSTNNVPIVDSGGSPGVTVYQAIAFGARALGIAFGTPLTWREKISSYGAPKAGFRHFCKKLQFTNWVNSGKPKFLKENKAILSQAYREIKKVGRKVQRLGCEVFSPITTQIAPGTLRGEEIVQVQQKCWVA